MSLNIKNERTHALVRELATLRGVSQTEAVEEAVRARLRELSHESEARRRLDRTMEIARDMAPGLAHLGAAERATDFLYDDAGLPS